MKAADGEDVLYEAGGGVCDRYGPIDFHTTCAARVRRSGGAVLGGTPTPRWPAWQWRARPRAPINSNEAEQQTRSNNNKCAALVRIC